MQNSFHQDYEDLISLLQHPPLGSMESLQDH